VEQTCSHVAVMSKGKMVAQGTVEELLADDGTVRLEVAGDARPVLEALPGVVSVVQEGGGFVAELDGISRAAVVSALVGAGIDVLGVTSKRRLEDVFLELLGTSA
jgi:ABC-2 type transport system ATP-binding protein